MNQWPNLPRSLARSQQIILDLASNSREGVTIDKSKVGEEDTHKDWTPEELIDGNLREDGCGISSGDLFVKPVVEVMSRGAVVDETEEGEGGETFVVYWSSSDEELFVFETSNN